MSYKQVPCQFPFAPIPSAWLLSFKIFNHLLFFQWYNMLVRSSSYNGEVICSIVSKSSCMYFVFIKSLHFFYGIGNCCVLFSCCQVTLASCIYCYLPWLY